MPEDPTLKQICIDTIACVPDAGDPPQDLIRIGNMRREDYMLYVNLGQYRACLDLLALSGHYPGCTKVVSYSGGSSDTGDRPGSATGGGGSSAPVPGSGSRLALIAAGVIGWLSLR